MISDYGRHLAEKLNVKFSKIEKLVPNFYEKKFYVLHIRNLQFYLSLGMQLTKIHRVLEFSQSRWLEPYIMKNTQMRAAATSAFEKDLYKLMNNATFGKTMENLRARQDIRLVTDPEQGVKLVRRPTFQSFKIVNENLTIVKLLKSRILMNKPIYAGMCILDLSKLHMYDFHYNVMKRQYGNKAKLLFTDTDSLAYDIETPNVYADMQINSHYYDTSDYPSDHPLHSKKNAKVLGKFKDELNGIAALEFVGLRAKMYSLLLPNNKSKNTAKGIPKPFVKKHITHEQYRDCLEKEITTTATFQTIRSFVHELKTIQMTKKALSAYDDKRYLLGAGGASLAYGHVSIPKIRDG